MVEVLHSDGDGEDRDDLVVDNVGVHEVLEEGGDILALLVGDDILVLEVGDDILGGLVDNDSMAREVLVGSRWHDPDKPHLVLGVVVHTRRGGGPGGYDGYVLVGDGDGDDDSLSILFCRRQVSITQLNRTRRLGQILQTNQ